MKRPANPADDVPHSLIPLTLAVGLVRHKAYDDRQVTNQGREGDFNMLAGFVAATVPIYEYPADRSAAARALRKCELEGGVFRNGGGELQFIDGRSTKRHLAVHATDMACVVSLLRDPEHTSQIRSRFARKRAQEIKAYSMQLREHAAKLCREAEHLRVRDTAAKVAA